MILELGVYINYTYIIRVNSLGILEMNRPIKKNRNMEKRNKKVKEENKE